MSRNFFKSFMEKKAWMGIALPAWVLASFVLVQIAVYLIVKGLGAVGVPLAGVNDSVLSTVYGVIVYSLTLLMVIGLPWLLKKYKTTREDLGLTRLPSWLDILLAPAGLVVYMIVSGLLILFAQNVLTFINWDQAQDTGFNQLYMQFEYILAFLTLVVIAPLAEEILFRGYLFGKLRQYVPLWVAILITSLLFAFVHGAWNVAIDVFALSIILCLLRVATKSLWPSILVHMLKNFIAFYLLFINPSFLSTLGG